MRLDPKRQYVVLHTDARRPVLGGPPGYGLTRVEHCLLRAQRDGFTHTWCVEPPPSSRLSETLQLLDRPDLLSWDPALQAAALREKGWEYDHWYMDIRDSCALQYGQVKGHEPTSAGALAWLAVELDQVLF